MKLVSDVALRLISIVFVVNLLQDGELDPWLWAEYPIICCEHKGEPCNLVKVSVCTHARACMCVWRVGGMVQGGSNMTGTICV